MLDRRTIANAFHALRFGSGPEGDRRTTVAIAFALLASGLTFIVYVPALSAGFVGDDFMILHRLRALTRAGDVGRFFGTEFFEYYRPLGFVAQAIDYAIAGSDPRQFHLTNILLHSLNTILVLLLGRQLSPHSPAGPLGALLFGLHASNHEAVIWISARFDLLATSFALAALLWMTRASGSAVLPAFLFGLAALAKESVAALPLAPAGWAVFTMRAHRRLVLERLAPWLVASAAYAAMRFFAGGVPATGGPGRLPKLVVLSALLCALVMLAGSRWIALRARLIRAQVPVALTVAALLAAMAAAAALSRGPVGTLAAEKLAVAGFAVFHLLSPIVEISNSGFYQDPSSMMYWFGGAIGLAVATGLTLTIWKRLLTDERVWFLGTFLIAALLPVSALTEGTRYLYLPSAAVSLLVGMLVGELRGIRFKAGLTLVTVVLAVSVVAIRAKIDDWNWSGAMTAEGARMVDGILAPGCGTGHVVFLTSPVGIRGVYNHFYYETFELSRGCRPETFRVMVRVVRIDATVDVRWSGPDSIVITTDHYDGNFVLSDDLRRFNRKLRAGDRMTIETPLGPLHVAPFGGSGQQLTLTLSPALRTLPHFFYYSAGRIHALPRPGADGRTPRE